VKITEVKGIGQAEHAFHGRILYIRPGDKKNTQIMHEAVLSKLHTLQPKFQPTNVMTFFNKFMSFFYFRHHRFIYRSIDKKLSYCWETVRRESMPRVAEMDVEMTT